MTNAFKQTLSRIRLPHLSLLAWLVSFSWFLTDDTFISFRYTRNLLDEHGLVFNPGEHVEGYTYFLWILELAAISSDLRRLSQPHKVALDSAAHRYTFNRSTLNW